MRFFISALVLIIASTTASAEEEVFYNLNAEEENFNYGLQYPVEDHPNCDYRTLRMEYRSGFGFLREDIFREFYMLITDTEGHLEADEFMNLYESTTNRSLDNTGLLLRVLTACDIYIVS